MAEAPNPVGRPPDLERQAWALYFGLSVRNGKRLSHRTLRMLSCAKSDEARRILLGITIKESDAPAPENLGDTGTIR